MNVVHLKRCTSASYVNPFEMMLHMLTIIMCDERSSLHDVLSGQPAYLRLLTYALCTWDLPSVIHATNVKHFDTTSWTSRLTSAIVILPYAQTIHTTSLFIPY